MLISGYFMEDLLLLIHDKATSSYQRVSVDWKQKVEKKKIIFFSSGGNILNSCCPWLSNAMASDIYTIGLVPEIPLIHKPSIPHMAGYLSLLDTMGSSPNKFCFFKKFQLLSPFDSDTLKSWYSEKYLIMNMCFQHWPLVNIETKNCQALATIIRKLMTIMVY